MRVTRTQMAANRERILAAASTLFRAKGFDAVTVSDVMKAAGMTHGAFYGHFSSKDELVAETVSYAMEEALARPLDGDFAQRVGLYLSPEHRDDPASGCPTAGLAGLLRLQPDTARARMTEGLEAQIALRMQSLAGDAATRRRQAIASWAAMVGALTLARAVDDPELSDEILKATREWLTATCHTSAAADAGTNPTTES